MAERSCVHAYIERVQRNIQNGGSYSDSVSLIESYRESLRRVYGDNRSKIHRIVTHPASLQAIAAYEHIRSSGAPIPDSRAIIGHLVPAKKRCRVILGGPDLTDTKVHLLDHN